MSGETKSPTVESHVIVLLARALWDSAKADHTTHYLLINLVESFIGIPEKSDLAAMNDAYVNRCASDLSRLVVLVITGEEANGVTFMVLSLPTEPDLPTKPDSITH